MSSKKAPGGVVAQRERVEPEAEKQVPVGIWAKEV